MTSTDELVRDLADHVRAKNATTFFLNAPPGAGKSHLLARLAKRLPERLAPGYALGPYSVDLARTEDLCSEILGDCLYAGFVDAELPRESVADLAGTWLWFAEHAQIRKGWSLLVFVDLPAGGQVETTALADLFSSARRIEGEWRLRGVRVFHMFAGHWDHAALGSHYDSTNTSFPYTVGRNYLIWPGLSVQEVDQLVRQAWPGQARGLHGQALFELSGGHVAVCLDILSRVEPGHLSLRALIEATREAAENGAAGQALIEAWARLPDQPRAILKQLLVRRHVADTGLPGHSDRLLASGCVQRERIGDRFYLGFRSWYAELLARLHADRLGIGDAQTQSIQVDELIPSVSEMNVLAYRLINDIENDIRNFVATHLCGRSNGAKHFLQDRCVRYRDLDGERIKEDAHGRAVDWRAHSAGRGMPTTLNPLLAYCSTSDLADIVQAIGRDESAEAWIQIATSLRQLRSIRDAVMHNQIIDDGALDRLYDLQSSIYLALNEDKSPALFMR